MPITYTVEFGGSYVHAMATGHVVEEMDGYEGVFVVMSSLAEQGPSRCGHLLPGWTAHCHTSTSWRADSTIECSLRFRLRNLVDRGYVDRHGHTYSITGAGLDYSRTRPSRVE